jgi:hypothetical protein
VQGLVRQRPVQLRAPQHLVVEALAHGRLEQRERVLALRLGGVHGQVHVLVQVLGAHRPVVRDGDADAGAHPHRAGADRERLAQRGQQPARVSGRVADVIGEHGELVAAEPHDGVREAEAGGQPCGHTAQQAVAGVVAQRVVDRFEVVEVEVDDRGRRGRSQVAVEALGEQGAIAEAGQRVVVGLAARSASGSSGRCRRGPSGAAPPPGRPARMPRNRSPSRHRRPAR